MQRERDDEEGRQPERAFYLATSMEFEVINGSFHQFFWNSTGDRARETHAALEALDQAEFLAIHRKPFAVFPGSRPAEDRATRAHKMRALPNEHDAWRSLNEEFYAIPGFCDAGFTRYIMLHRAELPYSSR